MAEVLGRYSKLSATGIRVRKAQDRAQHELRSEPWEAPSLSGRSRVRLVLSGRGEEIRAAYEAGATVLGLAESYGVPETTMRDFFHRECIVIRPQGKVTPEQVEEMARLRERGWTYKEIGDQFGVTRHAVMNRLRHR